MKWWGGSVNRGAMAGVLLALAGWILPAGAAPVTARYVRVDNPTAPGMSLQEVEVYSGGENVALGKGDSVTGTWKVFPGRKPTEGRQLVDGDNDPNKRGPAFSNVDHDVLGAWIEIDLGESVPIDRVAVYGSSYNAFLDKGDRVVTLLDDQRRVVWADKWNVLSAPDRTFDVNVTSSEGSSPMNGRTVPPNERLGVSMEWFLDPIEPERQPADAEARLARFQERLSPQALAEVADELFPLLDPNVPELAKARELYAQKKPAEALDEYKRYWFAKMARDNLKMAYHVLPPSYPGQADDLLNGVRVTVVPDAKQRAKATRFTPGAFPWVVVPHEDRARAGTLNDASFLAGVNNLQRPLLVRYGETGDPRYLQRWAELIDDWSMNYAKDADATPYRVQDNLGNCNAWNKTMEDLANIAEKHPEMIDLLPAATLARMQLRSLDEYGPAYWRLARETAFNHNVSNIQSWGFTVPYIREFLPGQRIDREWRQHMERWMTLFMEPDGSMVEIGDEGHFPMPMFLGYNWKWFEEIKPEWFTPGWRNRAWDMLDMNQLQMFRHVAPGGYDHRFDHRFYADRLLDLKHPSYYRPGVTRDDYPDRSAIHRIPEVRRILDAVFMVSAGVPEPGHYVLQSEKGKRSKQRNFREDALKILGDDRPGEPKIASDWMPYTGSYYFRGGWGEGNAFLAMLARNSRGGSEPNWGPATWSYGLVYTHDYNHPLMRAETPLINGLPQNPFGDRISYQPGAKTSALTYAERDPAQHRWHNSDRFAFGEAVFNGGYRKIDINYGNWLYGPEPGSLKLSEEQIRDVRANRQVHQLRQNRLFIVTDSIHFKDPAEAANSHEFDLQLRLMLSALKERGTSPFSTDQLVVDQEKQILSTRNPDGPNVALHQFTAAPLKYLVQPSSDLDFKEHSAALTENVGIATQRVSAVWEGKGDATAVTLIASSPQEEPSPVRVIEALPGTTESGNVVGFRAQLTDGTEMWYQASSGQPAPLVCGPFSMTGESLLVMRNPAGETSGIGIGGSDLHSGGTAIETPCPDFEFVAAPGGAPTFTPIHRPILNVRFKPDINTFVDQTTVEMTCETPNVEIRYTTDGTPPTRESTLYTGPITITESTEFAARAYRLGPDGKPLPAEDFEINGTKFTLPSYGWFYKEPLRPAVADAGSTKPGLIREKVKGGWRKLYGAGHWLPGEPAGVVSEVMDLNGAKSDDYYGVRFKGYLTVPADGVYTFYAPREFVLPDVAASYDLRVYVDGEEWDLTQWWHGHGTWSIPLAKGTHRFEVDFMDARTTPWRKTGLYRMYPRPWVEHQGDPTPLTISGPGIEKQTIPAGWLSH